MLRLFQQEFILFFVAIDMSRDLAHTCFTHAHLKSNWRALVLVTLNRQLNMMYCLKSIFCPSQILVLYLQRVFTCVNFSHTSLSVEQIMTKFLKRMSSICFGLLFFSLTFSFSALLCFKNFRAN